MCVCVTAIVVTQNQCLLFGTVVLKPGPTSESSGKDKEKLFSRSLSNSQITSGQKETTVDCWMRSTHNTKGIIRSKKEHISDSSSSFYCLIKLLTHHDFIRVLGLQIRSCNNVIWELLHLICPLRPRQIFKSG